MSKAAIQGAQGASDDIIGEVGDLDESFDATIRAIPQSLISAPDDFAIEPELSLRPLPRLEEIRDRCGYIVQGQNGMFGGLPLPNNFGIDLSQPHFAVLGVAEQDAISKDDEQFRNKHAYGALGDAQELAYGQVVGTIPTLVDSAEHDGLRAVYDTFLNQRTMTKRAEQIIEPVCTWLIDRVASMLERGEPVCLCRDFAVPLTYKAMGSMVGVPHNRLNELAKLGEQLFSAGVRPEEGLRAGDALYDFFLSEVEGRKECPGKDVLSFLVSSRNDRQCMTSDEEMAIAGRFLLPAGIETTWRGVALMLLSLLSHPDQYREVCQDPRLMRRAVEESLRYAPSGFITPRLATSDIEVSGIAIPKGSHITIYQGITNRDPRRWEEPNVFNIHREFKSHRTFNSGIHSCVGQHLARTEMLSSLRLFAQKLPRIELSVDPAEIEVRGLQVRTPLRIPVRLA